MYLQRISSHLLLFEICLWVFDTCFLIVYHISSGKGIPLILWWVGNILYFCTNLILVPIYSLFTLLHPHPPPNYPCTLYYIYIHNFTHESHPYLLSAIFCTFPYTKNDSRVTLKCFKARRKRMYVHNFKSNSPCCVFLVLLFCIRFRFYKVLCLVRNVWCNKRLLRMLFYYQYKYHFASGDNGYKQTFSMKW